jgi:molybdopterin/thiamine biosynthesis adenylyltransferase
MRKDLQTLNELERTRYLRQMAIEGFGEQAQTSLKSSTVTVMGVGGLGSPAALYLAAAGVGKIILVDFQAPDLSNLNRQVLHWEDDVKAGRKKADSGVDKLRKLNSEIEIVAKVARIGDDDLGRVIEDSDLVVDCLDNFDARKVLNAHCVAKRLPFVHAAVEGFSGQLTTIVPGDSPCLECIFPTSPKKKPLIPIIGFTAGVFGCMEAAEAVKTITGLGVPLVGRMLFGDLSSNYWETVEIERNCSCSVCRDA